MSDLAASIRNIPPVTRFFTTSTMLVCLLGRIYITFPTYLYFDLDTLFNQFYNFMAAWRNSTGPLGVMKAVGILLFQSHRFVTCFLVPWGMVVHVKLQAIFDIYFFYTFANHLESSTGKFRKNFPDCLWFTLLTGTIILLISLLHDAVFGSRVCVHHQMMLSCVTYIWSRESKNSVINFLGILPIKAYYLPIFNVFIKLFLNDFNSFIDSIIGIIGGYLYQCIQSDTWPIYNLFPGSYGDISDSNTKKVGFSVVTLKQTKEGQKVEYIGDAIFDLGYLKAPRWLYNLLNYPIGTSVRRTPHQRQSRGASARRAEEIAKQNTGGDDQSTGTTSGFNWFGNDQHKFQGVGRRLCD